MPTKVAKKMKELKKICKAAASSQGIAPIPRHQPVTVKAWFFLRRPDGDFVNKTRAVGRVKASALTQENTVMAIKPDVDNLCKFLLDSLTKALYVDDAQVVEVHLYKLRDNEGMCEGRMQIECSIFNNGVETMMPSF